MPKKSASTVSTTSSGKRRVSRARLALRRVMSKIARWDKYREANKPAWSAKKEKDRKSRNRSRYNNWNTDGLKKHAALLEAIIDKGRKVKVVL